MATQIPTKTVVAVNASNVVIGAGGTAGTAVRQRQIIIRAVSSNGKVIESDGSEGVVSANPPTMAVRIVDASNAIIKSDGTASASLAQPEAVVMFVGSDGVGFGSSGSGIPVMDVHVVDETSTLVDTLFGSGHSNEAEAFIARTSGLDATHTSAYYTLIDGLVDDGVFAKLDVLYCFATQDSTTALLNLVQNNFNGDTTGHAPTFAADQGFTGNASTAYVDSGFNPITASGHYAQDSACLGTWCRTAPASTTTRNFSGFLGSDVKGSSVSFDEVQGGSIHNGISGGINVGLTDPNDMVPALTPGTGFLLANRSASDAQQLYLDGSSVATSSTASVVLTNAVNIWFLSRNFDGSTNQSSDEQIAVGVIGGSLGSSDVTALHSRLSTYLTAVGAI